MPRRHRLVLPGVSLHVIQRGHDRQPCFLVEDDYLNFLDWLQQQVRATRSKVHAYVLMTNHVHLLLTPETSTAISSLFQGIGRHFVPHMNKAYQRRGSLWEGRHKGSIIESETYFLTCMRYIEMNPVRAGMVDHPAQYR